MTILSIFFDIKGIVHKEFALSGQTVDYAYYCDVLRRLRKNVRDFAPNLGDKRTCVASRQRTVSCFFFTRELFTINMTVVPRLPYFSLFPRLKIKLKLCHFDLIEMIEAESRSLLKTLTEHEFQDAFKIWQKSWERCTLAEGNYLKCDRGQ
jgi:hypothetical protein